MSAADTPVPAFEDPGRCARLLTACPGLDALFRERLDDKKVPGYCFGVVADGALVHAAGGGVARLGAAEPPGPDTAFRIASMTKSFTAAAVLALRDAGELALDDDIATHVPELRSLAYPTRDSAPLTVRDLLTMSAGWPQDDPWADRQLYRDDASMSELFEAGVTFASPPATAFEYSNYAYFVLGRIVTRLSGRPAIEHITETLLEPLGMSATRWQTGDYPASDRADGHRYEDEAWRREETLPCGGDVAAFAGLWSTVRDLSRWVSMFLSAWPARDDPEAAPLRRSSLREMQRVWRATTPGIAPALLGVSPRPRAGGYGLGLSVADDGRRETVGHGGGLPGFGSHMRWSPARGVGVVVLANVTYAGVHQLCEDALDVLTDTAAAPRRRVRPSRALEVAREGIDRLIAAWDDGLADDLFADNFFLDLDRAHWRRALEAVRAAHGELVPDGGLDTVNWLRGEWRLRGERGHCVVWATLAPTVPPRVQTLRVRSVLPPPPPAGEAVERVVGLLSRPVRRELDRVLARGADRDAAWAQLRLAAIAYGESTVAAQLEGDGRRFAKLRLRAGDATCLLGVGFDESGRLTRVEFEPEEMNR